MKQFPSLSFYSLSPSSCLYSFPILYFLPTLSIFFPLTLSLSLSLARSLPHLSPPLGPAPSPSTPLGGGAPRSHFTAKTAPRASSHPPCPKLFSSFLPINFSRLVFLSPCQRTPLNHFRCVCLFIMVLKALGLLKPGKRQEISQ